MDTEVGTAGSANTPSAGYERKSSALLDHTLPGTVEPWEGTHRAQIMEKPGDWDQQHVRVWVIDEKIRLGNKQKGNKSLLPLQPSNLLLVL